MHRFPSRNPKKRAFTLVELIVVIVVLGILATLATMAFRANIDRSIEAKQRQRTMSLLREARTLYVQKIYQDSTYTWQQAIIDATADLPAYKNNALSDLTEGISATGGTNLNTASNSWTLESDTGSGVYSTVSSELVFKVQSSTLYVGSYVTSTRGVFGMVSQDTPPSVWSAGCGGSSCDAESATAGPPASGVYAPGTTAAPTLVASGTLSGWSIMVPHVTVWSPCCTGDNNKFSIQQYGVSGAFQVGDSVTLSSASNSAFNGTFLILATEESMGTKYILQGNAATAAVAATQTPGSNYSLSANYAVYRP